MNAETRRRVRERAKNRFEYCGCHQDDDSVFRFQIEHIIARQHGGLDSEENLALACLNCNLNKGPNLAGIDPDSGTLTRLFHPRSDKWADHFNRRGQEIVGLTAIGRATVQVLKMNLKVRRNVRKRDEIE
jgi:hypothetical protein